MMDSIVDKLRSIARHEAQITSLHLEIREHEEPDSVGPETRIEWVAADQIELLQSQRANLHKCADDLRGELDDCQHKNRALQSQLAEQNAELEEWRHNCCACVFEEDQVEPKTECAYHLSLRVERDKEVERLKGNYHELLYMVEKKYPGETRHETALRYIREQETRPAGLACSTTKQTNKQTEVGDD